MRLTERFPALIPIRLAQRSFCFYLKMKVDGERYARKQSVERLPYLLKQIEHECINPNSGYDIVYQYNKLENFKTVAKTMNHLIIHPKETFSFWQSARHADKTSYKEGLCIINGKMSTAKGGGLCGLSNQLFELFLHSDLTMIEHHTHSKEYITPKKDELLGVDAAVIEGWKDLKFKNETDESIQLVIGFKGTKMITSLYSSKPHHEQRILFNRNLQETLTDEGILHQVEVWRRIIDKSSNKMIEKPIYKNTCLIVMEENQ